MLDTFSGFISRGDMIATSNTSIHHQDKNSNLRYILPSIGINLALSPVHSLESNLIELAFNIMVKKLLQNSMK